MADLDPNTVATSVSIELVKTFVEEIKKSTVGALSKKVLPHLMSFSSYLEKTHNRCANIRILTNRDVIYELEKVYVGGRYRQNGNLLEENYICQKARDSGRIVVQGFGGIGKTVLLKHLWLSVFKEPQGKIPVFLELRRVNDLSTINLLSYIKHSLSGPQGDFSDDAFHELLIAGRFIFLMDGFDELYDHIREAVQAEINQISHNYPKVGIVVSSRKDDRFYSWERFEIFEAAPFEQKQTLALMRKIDFDSVIKKKFVSEIIEKQFSKYESFLSTPLLALIMLLTFRQFAEVTPKLHIFYRHAYQTLYSLHDASKEAFSRERKSGLDEDQFEKIFSLFCLASYMELDFSFNDEKMKAYLERAKRRADIAVSSKKFIEEVVESVNLMHRDGDTTIFTHRSFQEYFAAKAAVSYFPGRVGDIFRKLPNRPGDSVLNLAYDINPDVVEEEYVLQEYSNILSDLTFIRDGSNDLFAKLKLLDATLMLDASNRGDWVLFLGGPLFSFCGNMSRFFEQGYIGFGYGPGRRHSNVPKLERITSAAVKSLKARASFRTGLLLFNFQTQSVEVEDFESPGGRIIPGGFEDLPISSPSLRSALSLVLQEFLDNISFVDSAMAAVTKRKAARAKEISDLL